jgi:hypothetical protein
MLFKNRVLKRIFGPKREGGKGGRRKLHNQKLHKNKLGSRMYRLENDIKYKGCEGSGQSTMAGSRELDNEPSGFTRRTGDFLN